MPAGALRRLGGGLLVLVVAAAGAYGLIALLTARDSSNVSVSSGPGQPQLQRGDAHLPRGSADPVYPTNPPTSGAHVVVPVLHDAVALTSDELLSALERGDVVFVYGDTARTPALHALATSLAGPFTPALAAAGQAVILDPLSTVPRGSITALAWGHAQPAAHVGDPALASFASFWLGRGVPGGGVVR